MSQPKCPNCGKYCKKEEEIYTDHYRVYCPRCNIFFKWHSSYYINEASMCIDSSSAYDYPAWVREKILQRMKQTY